MNFWRSFGFYTPSPIDNILEKEAFELEELLDEDDIIHELNSHNKNLLAYLSGGDVLETVVKYVLGHEGLELDEGKRSKYASVCTDILALEAWTIADAVCSQDNLVHMLYSFMEKEAPLDSQIAVRGGRILSSLMQQKPVKMVEFFRSQPNTVDRFIVHLGSAPVLELLLKVISCDESARTSGDALGTVQWLCNEDLIPKLVSLLDVSHSDLVHENAGNALCDIVAFGSSPGSYVLHQQLQSPAIVTSIFEHTFSEISLQSSTLKHGLPIIAALIESLPHPNVEDGPLPPVLATLEKFIPQLTALLETSSGDPVELTFGRLDPPFGVIRMKAIELCVQISKSRHESLVYRTFVEQRLFVTCFQLFFKYQFNNMLHRFVADIAVTFLEGPDLALKTALFDECDFHTMIAVNSVGDGPRKGFMGYVTDIAMLIEREAEDLEPIKERLETSDEWKKYVEEELVPTKKICFPNVMANTSDSGNRFDIDSKEFELQDSMDVHSLSIKDSMDGAGEGEEQSAPAVEEVTEEEEETNETVAEETPVVEEEEEKAINEESASAEEESAPAEVEDKPAEEDKAAVEEEATKEDEEVQSAEESESTQSTEEVATEEKAEETKADEAKEQAGEAETQNE